MRDAAWYSTDYPDRFKHKLTAVLQRAWRIDYALLAVLGVSFPVFLVPSPEDPLVIVPSVLRVRVRWDETGWYLHGVNEQRLFSFDLPKELFELYADAGVLTPDRALDLKKEQMISFHAFQTINEQVRVIRFELDMPWLEAIRERLNTSPE